ncbi:MAG: hypothetical protein JNK72_15705 [Myxococcales bacterium]|nr:hypothetical protein [Myxococcales bacterium]
MVAALATVAGCLIPSAPEFATEPPLSPPQIVDAPGLTRPRVGNIVLVEQGNAQSELIEFNIPVDDLGVDETLQFNFFVNGDRDCVQSNGASDCAQTENLRELPPSSDRARRRFITWSRSFRQLGCNRVELYVTSSRFLLNGNFHTPARDGDLAFASWWVFVRAPAGSTSTSDAGTGDSVERCPYIVP